MGIRTWIMFEFRNHDYSLNPYNFTHFAPDESLELLFQWK